MLAAGEPVPHADLPEWLLGVWRAWWRLHADRPWRGGGLGPAIPGRIPWRDVVSWAEFHDMPGDQVQFLDACIGEMDAEYFDWYQARLPKGGA